MVASPAPPDSPLPVRLHPVRPLALPVAAFTVGAATVAYLASERVGAGDLTVLLLVSCLAWPVAAVVLLDCRPGHPLGHLMALPGLLPLVGAVAAMPAGGARPLPVDVVAAGAFPAALMACIAFVAMPLLVTATAERPAPRPSATSLLPGTLAACALPAVVLAAVPGVPPAGRLPDPRYLGSFAVIVLVAATVGAHLVLGRVWRRSAGAGHDRLGWYLVGSAVVGPAAVGLGWLVATGAPALATYALAAVLATVPCAVAALLLSAAPPALDRALARAAAFVAVTVALAAVYVGAVAGLAASGLPDGPVGAAVLTGTAALIAVPLWGRCRSWTERLLFGAGRRPETVLAGMRRGVGEGHPAGALAAVTDWVADALRSPAVRVHGTPDAGESTDAAGGVAVELRVAGVLIGFLEVAPRVSGERYGRRDRALLDQLAVPVALVAQSVAANRALERSEQRVSEERLQERRRVLDDIHDGLGPALAGVGLQLEAARSRLCRGRSCSDDGLALLDTAIDGVRQARTGMRQLALDLGSARAAPEVRSFVGTVAELVQGWAVAGREVGLTVRLETCDVPETLAPEVGTAAYRIVGEAVTNVVRHARASHCAIRIERSSRPDGREEMVIRVRDDGCGLDPGGSRDGGTGLRSMRSRAEALGGSLELGRSTGAGTVLLARLPLPETLR